MLTTVYTQHPEVQSMINTLRAESRRRPEGLVHSPIRDAAGNQYIDLVMEGGGTLGVALLGYIYVLEQVDIRFLQLAGTSAGSIMAMLLAGGGPIDLPKSEWLIEKVANKNFYDFVDGDEEVQHFVDALLDADTKKRKKARYTTKIIDDLQDYYGLNPGIDFHTWMTELLQERGVITLADLQAVRAIAPAGMVNVQTGTAVAATRWQRISVVTADITTGTKVAFPDMAPLYWADPDSVNPADFVRASMSIPVFFYPFIVENLPTGSAAQENWATLANYHGPVPPAAYFADGGSMSNFPMDLFYTPGNATDAPVLGIKIGMDRNQYTSCDSFGAYAGAMLGSMMAFHDNSFFMEHPEINRNVGTINTGDYNWLDFSISDEGKLDLFVRGAQAAYHFLMGFE